MCIKKRKILANVRHRQRRPILKALRMARADAGLTISELARRAGVSRDTISNAERGEHGLQATTLHKVARALGKTPSELLAEEERLAPIVESRSPFEPSLDDVLAEERRVAEMPSWVRAGLEKGAFVERFEAAKESEEAAHQLHREEFASLERAEAKLGTLRARNVIVAKARTTAAAFLWTEILRGRDVSAVDPVEIVAGVIEAQHSLLKDPQDGTSGAADPRASEAG